MNLISTEKASETRIGLITAHLGVAVEVRFSDGSRESIRVKRNSGHVVGDKVNVVGEILQRLPRRTELRRRDARGGIRLVAANLDVLGIVVCPTPAPPKSFVDRAIVASRAAGLEPFLVVNKCDLPGAEEMVELFCGTYSPQIPVFAVSAHRETGFESLLAFFGEKHRGAFVGTSGVGKSSLLNVICPEIDLKIGEINENLGLGRHTTSVSTLHALSGGGELVDTPGFRDFGLVDISSRDIAAHFPGFEEVLETPCRFRDCRHVKDPGCSVLSGVAEGMVPADRHRPYLEILAELEEYELSERRRRR